MWMALLMRVLGGCNGIAHEASGPLQRLLALPANAPTGARPVEGRAPWLGFTADVTNLAVKLCAWQ